MSDRKVKTADNLDAGPHRYDRYGFLVPPYARPDYVCRQVLDHTEDH